MKNTYWIILLMVIGFAMPMLGQADGKDVRISTKLSKNTNIQGITTSTKDYDVKYYRLNLKADPAVRFIQGTVTTYFVPKINGFNAIQFNLKNNMSVDSVKYHGNHVPSYNFSTAVILNIELPAILQQNTLDSISVYYKGQPANDGFGSFGLGTTSCFPNDKVMWTLSEPYGAKSWWPCKETLDDKADSLDMIITCPIPYKVASNGLLVDSIINPDATMTYHWKHRYPIPAYLVAFAIADYKTFSDYITIPNSTPIEVLNYLYKCNTLHRDTIKSRIDLTLKFFVEKFGPYPYKNEKYGHAQCGFGGGMEHATMSFMGGFSRYLIAHELAHQWFGDKITCGSWQDIWLNEGFATYLEGLTCEKGYGDQSWLNWKTGKINHVTGYNFGSTYVTDTIDINSIFNSRLVYNKGALILHMLRWKLGDTKFFESIYNYINDPVLSYSFAKTNDLRLSIENTTGIDLADFFNDWVYGQGWPLYDIKWAKDPICQKVYVTVNQSHSANQGIFYELPVPIAFSNGINIDTVVFDQASPSHTSFDYSLGFSPITATFDPEKWLCAKANVTEIPYNNQRTIRWLGQTSSDWHTPSNWDCGVPTAADEVIIPKGSPMCVIQSNTSANCRKIIIEETANFKTESGATLHVHH